jgi:serine/threonine-protein kinase
MNLAEKIAVTKRRKTVAEGSVGVSSRHLEHAAVERFRGDLRTAMLGRGGPPCHAEVQPMSTPSPLADRNLIFGLFALQMDFVSREQLLNAMHAWMLRKAVPLSQILREVGLLNERRAALLDELVAEHISRHGNAQASLAALRVEPQVRQDLDRLDDPDVRSSISSLTTTEGTQSYLAEDSVARPERAAPEASPADGVRYRRLREHARGGLGEVHVALDVELKREVALKEIQERFADDSDSRMRFVREAEITGQLEHPGVVPVYGLGCYSDGRLFYAMRFIRGEAMESAIKRFHQADEQPGRESGERSLELRELLGRFVAVCNTVAYAHSRGVIHRDLKPANVMLGEFGETIVVDWGLAKALDQAHGTETVAERPVPSGSGSSTATQMGQAVGTAGFMPPEQATGRLDELAPASDVFALGATLYAVLTGRAPYRGRDAKSQAQKAEVMPARQRKRSVPAALEAVCAKAMAASPEERYADARKLAEEVRRWLADEPLDAYHEPLADRLRRWGRRHRTLVGVSMALLLAGVLALGAGLWLVNAEKTQTAIQRDRAVEAEDRERHRRAEAEANLARALKAEEQAKANLKQAQDNLKLARQAIDECFNIAKTNPVFQGPRMEKARNLLLRKTLPFYRNFRVQRPDDRLLQREEADQWFRVGYIEYALLRTPEATEAYTRSLGLFQALVKAQPDLPAFQQDLATTHNNLALLLSAQGKSVEALKHYQQARDLFQQLVKAHPEVAQYQQEVASTHHNLGILLLAQGKSEEALKHYQQARDLQQHLVNAHPHQHSYQSHLAGTLNDLASLLAARGRGEEALGHHQHARDLFLQLVKAHPELPEYQSALARTQHNLAALLSSQGKREEALKHYEQANDLLQRLVKAHPDLPAYQHELAGTHNNMALLLSAQGKGEEALKHYQQARDLFLQLVKAHPHLHEYQNALASTLNNLGSLLSAHGKREEALKHFQQVRELRQQLVKAHPDLPRYQKDLARTHNNLALLLRALGKPEEAMQHHQQARDRQEKLVKAHPDLSDYGIDLAGTCCNTGIFLSDSGKASESLDHFARAVALLQAIRQRDPNQATARLFLRNSHMGRALALTRLGRHREAVADWDQAMPLDTGGARYFIRLKRADNLARGGDYRRASAEADDLARHESLPGATLYNLACIQAINAASAGRDASRPLPERDKRGEDRARAAVALLKRAAAAGLFGENANVGHLDNNPDLAALRDRDDYKRFRAALRPEHGRQRL